jgi:CRISPR-associated protein Csb2
MGEIAVYRVGGLPPLPFGCSLPVAEKVRTILMGISSHLFGENCVPESFSGHDRQGNRLKLSHSHATITCIPSSDFSIIEHICVVLGKPFDESERLVLDQVHKLWDTGEITWPLEKLCTAPRQSAVEFLPEDTHSFLKPSRTWATVTPFMKTRHLRVKRSEKHSEDVYYDAIAREISQNINEELEVRGLPEPVEIKVVPGASFEIGDNVLNWSHFVRSRAESHGAELDYGHGVIMSFSEPVPGPITLGRHSHFGMGLFKAI